jgi:hypothetical protein
LAYTRQLLALLRLLLLLLLRLLQLLLLRLLLLIAISRMRVACLGEWTTQDKDAFSIQNH